MQGQEQNLRQQSLLYANLIDHKSKESVIKNGRSYTVELF